MIFKLINSGNSKIIKLFLYKNPCIEPFEILIKKIEKFLAKNYLQNKKNELNCSFLAMERKNKKEKILKKRETSSIIYYVTKSYKYNIMEVF